jgi:hypothetical protein
MASKVNDVIGGFNKLLEDQKACPGECTVTLVQFDTQNAYEILRDFVPVSQVSPLGSEYSPRGGTPLFDAVGRAIVNTGDKLKSLSEHERPGKVVVVIISDGEENSSREYRADAVAKMVKEQTEIYKWQFVYLGTNHDAMLAAGNIGIVQDCAANYAEEKTSGGIQLASSKLRSYRTGAAADMNWSADERKALS